MSICAGFSITAGDSLAVSIRLAHSTQVLVLRSARPIASTGGCGDASEPVLFGRRHSVDVPPKSVDPADAASPSSHVDMLPIDPPTSGGITARGGRLLQQSVPEDISAPGPIGAPVPQASTLSRSGNEVGGPVLAPTAWPDPVPTGVAAQAQNPIAIPTNNIPADLASFDARITPNAGNSMATILAILALVLAALCVVAKNGAMRRAPTIIDQREHDDQRQDDSRGGQGQRGSIDEGQLLVSALSDCGLIRNDEVPFETAFEFVSAKISWRDCTRISIGCCRRRQRRSVGGGEISPLLFKERLIYEQSAARTVREQQEKRSCDWSRQPLKIEQLSPSALRTRRTQQHPTPSPLYGASTRSVQRFLAGLASAPARIDRQNR